MLDAKKADEQSEEVKWMIDNIWVGHFDHDALEKGAIVVVKSLDKEVVCGLLSDVGELFAEPTEDACLGRVDGFPFWWREGCLLCISPVVRPSVVNFIACLVRKTGCEILHDPTKSMFTLEGFVSHSQWLSGLQREANSPRS
jgi:hypothetical protein